ncbi:ead/Ea22-like family protein [Paramicrobacterium sp. CJ85]|uniref:ead/Ea22-like family protein n=1 Tax=Paramicrobacterium sp. CJ85 TaxID=3445355 RepID=UPI003F5E1F55
MTDLDLAELERLAKAATPGPWSWCAKQTADGDSWAVLDSHDHALAMNTDGWVLDAEFIAATDPQTVLALIERAESAERRIAVVREMHRPIDIEPSDTICGECSLQLPNGHFFGKVVEWPCETVKALTEGDEQ